jgi:hypothetical protein
MNQAGRERIRDFMFRSVRNSAYSRGDGSFVHGDVHLANSFQESIALVSWRESPRLILQLPRNLGAPQGWWGGLPATGGGWIEGRAPHIGRLLVVRRCALIVRADRLLSIGGPSPGDEVDDRHRDVRLVRAPRRRRDHPDDGRRNAGGTGPQGRGAETGEIDQAIRLAQNTEFDLAILDVNVQGKLITPVAELITTLMRPIIFATGYGTAGVPEEFRGRPSLEKPCSQARDNYTFFSQNFSVALRPRTAHS